MRREVFEELISGEVLYMTFAFDDRMVLGETITFAGCVASVHSGVDPAPAAVILGGATVEGQTIVVKVTSSLPGVTYGLTAGIETSTGQVLKKQAYLAIIPAVA